MPLSVKSKKVFITMKWENRLDHHETKIICTVDMADKLNGLE